MNMKTVVTMAALVAFCAACSDAVGPQVTLTIEGKVEGLRAGEPPADITVAAHADDDCTAGAVLARATTRTRDDGTYSVTMRLPEGSTVCLAVDVVALTDGSTVARRLEKGRVPVLEGEVVHLPPVTIRLVITRPSP